MMFNVELPLHSFIFITNYLPMLTYLSIYLVILIPTSLKKELRIKMPKVKGIPPSPELLRKSIAEIMPLLSHWRKTTGLSLCSRKLPPHSKSETDLGYEGEMIIYTVVKKSSTCTSYSYCISVNNDSLKQGRV